MTLRVLLAVVAIVLAACAGPRFSKPPPVQDLAMTCWRLSGPGLAEMPFWRATVRLDTASGRPNHGGRPERALVRLPPETRDDLGMVFTTWRMAGADSLELFTGTDFFGTSVGVRVRGDRMRGSSRGGGDALGFNHADSTRRVIGVRVACVAPSAGKVGEPRMKGTDG